jgi:hypothetical protein
MSPTTCLSALYVCMRARQSDIHKPPGAQAACSSWCSGPTAVPGARSSRRTAAAAAPSTSSARPPAPCTNATAGARAPACRGPSPPRAPSGHSPSGGGRRAGPHWCASRECCPDGLVSGRGLRRDVMRRGPSGRRAERRVGIGPLGRAPSSLRRGRDAMAR